MPLDNLAHTIHSIPIVFRFQENNEDWGKNCRNHARSKGKGNQEAVNVGLSLLTVTCRKRARDTVGWTKKHTRFQDRRCWQGHLPSKGDTHELSLSYRQ